MNMLNGLSVAGWASDGAVWRPVQESLSDRITVVAVPWWHALGAGEEDNELHHRLLELPGPTVVFGWSLGALIALRAARLFPEQVGAVITVGGTARMKAAAGHPGVAERRLAAMRARLDRNPRHVLDEFAELCFAPDEAGVPELVAQYATAALRISHESLAAGLQFLDEVDLRDDVRHITCPVLVIHGEADAIVPPASAHHLAAALPNASLAMVPGAGHALLHTHSDTVAQAIGSFLDAHFSV